ncbi:hypothetical protein SDC9_203667 [bioreactor metagenome]|uniref:Uncharacterized protein n=1 Tax=bioreactor metagenome TaxID=1076179 RepID=A0A645J8Z9_9ZZZZ
MDAHRTVVFAAAAKQIAQCKVQFGGVGVVLYGLDKGIDGLVLLLVEQKVQTLEVRLGSLAVVGTHLAQIPAGGQPAQHKGRRQAQQDPSQIKFHARRPAQ